MELVIAEATLEAKRLGKFLKRRTSQLRVKLRNCLTSNRRKNPEKQKENLVIKVRGEARKGTMSGEEFSLNSQIRETA